MVKFAVLACAGVALVAGYAFVPGWHDVGTHWVNAYSVPAAVAWIILVTVWLRRRPEPAMAWLGIVVAMSVMVLGDIIYDAIGGDPAVSIADAVYIVGYVILAGSSWALLHAHAPQRNLGSAIEAGMVAIATLFASWLFVVEPRLHLSEVTVAGRWLVVAYPVLATVTIFLLVRALFAAGWRWSIAAVALGMVAVLGSEGSYAVLQQTSDFTTGQAPVIEAGWLALYLAAAWAIMRAAEAPEPTYRPATTVFGPVRIVAAGAALIALPTLFAVAVFAGNSPSIGGFVVATLALVPLVLWRGATLQAQITASHQQMHERETYYRAIAERSSDLTLVTDFDGNVVDASGSTESLTGHARPEFIGKRLLDLIDPVDHPQVAAALAKIVDIPSAPQTIEVRIRRVGGSRWVSMRCTNLDDDPAVGGLVVNLHDIDTRKRVEAALEHQALHDPMTGLANRRLLRDRAAHAMLRRTRTGQDVVLVVLGLDRFKTINEAVGPDAGDRLLTTIAARLATSVRPDDTVARIAGDQFALLVEGEGNLEGHALELGERIRTVVADPIDLNGLPVVVTTSVGVAVASQDAANSADELFRNADTALSAAKAAGRDQLMRYRATMPQASLNRVQIAADLRHAVDREQLVVHYQTIHRLTDGEPVGIEALVRWHHPTRGLLLPWRFVSIAEQAGSIAQVGAWVLATACERAAAWFEQAGNDTLTLSVNLSSRQLRDDTLAAQINTILADTGLAPHRLVLELTETALVTQPEIAVERLGAIKELGVRLAIDDFGVGYASLNYLRQFPADILKIDRSYVNAIRRSDEVPPLVKGLLELGRTLGLEVVAEGVESDVQRQALIAEGCAHGQGFLFSQAVAADELDVDGLRPTSSPIARG